MSTLQVSNISDGTTTVGTEYVVNGSAKAFVGVGLTNNYQIYDSFNVSSVTDDGTGSFTDSLTNNFTQADRVTGSQSGGDRVNTSSTNSSIAIRGSGGLTTSGGSYSAGYHTGGHNTDDVDYANIIQFGDPA